MLVCSKCGGQVLVRDDEGQRASNSLGQRAEYHTCIQCGKVEYFQGAAPTYHLRDSQEAFEDALVAGVLSHNEQDRNWVGHYMYMCTASGVDQFKHRDTRQSLNHNRYPDTRNAPAPRPKVGRTVAQ